MTNTKFKSTKHFLDLVFAICNFKLFTMPLNQAKYIVDLIKGVRCRVVEITADKKRIQFLKKLLEHNGYTVMTDKTEEDAFRIGVTDVVFNPVIAVYERHLQSRNDHRVTPAYWLQLSDKETEKEVNYWGK
jgi:hypothetical protein